MSDVTYIYGLWDCESNLRYIGKSNDPINRLNGHIECAINGGTFHIHVWIRKLLSEGLEPQLDILEEVHIDNWQYAEREWIADCLRNDIKLVNMTSGGDGIVGLPRDVRKRASAITGAKLKGRKLSDKTKKKMSDFHKNNPVWKGRKHSEDTKKKMSDARIGYKISDSTRAKRAVQLPPMTGKHHTIETKRKISNSKTGKKMSDEAKLSQREKKKKNYKPPMLGKKFSLESRKKMSESHKGKKMSDEQKHKISVSTKLSYERKYNCDNG